MANPKNLRGGKRRGAGRKPSPKTILARLALAELDEEAEKSIRFFVFVRDNEKATWGIRLEAAKELVDRRFGKAKQPQELTGKNGKPLIPAIKPPDLSGISTADLVVHIKSKRLSEGGPQIS